MKWFIRVLRHYADFSGRSRRKEYWMFALFNFLFSIAWTFLLFIKPTAPHIHDELFYMVQLSWLAMVALPGMAVAVRRLHDIGKSGWMLLVGLIPAVGAVWLFILMVKAGQPGGNIYGPDPKRSPEIFPDSAKLTSAGIVLTVSTCIAILLSLVYISMSSVFNAIYFLVIDGLLITAGVMLINCRHRPKAKTALIIIMSVAGIISLRGMLGWTQLPEIIERGGWRFAINSFVYPLLYITVTLFTAAAAFAPKGRFLRGTGLLLIVAACINLAWRAYSIDKYWTPDSLAQTLDLFTFLTPVAYIVLAGTFLSRKQEPAISLSEEGESMYEADQQVVYRPSSPGNIAELAPGGSGQSLTWKIIGLFVSIGLIVGGASGEMVLRGTKSSEALVVAGIIFLIADIYSLATHNKKRKGKSRELPPEDREPAPELETPATIRVVRDSSIVGAIVPYRIYLNDAFVGKIKNGKVLDIATYSSFNVITVFDDDGNPFRGDFTVELEAGGQCEVHVKAGRFVKDK